MATCHCAFSNCWSVCNRNHFFVKIGRLCSRKWIMRQMQEIHNYAGKPQQLQNCIIPVAQTIDLHPGIFLQSALRSAVLASLMEKGGRGLHNCLATMDKVKCVKPQPSRVDTILMTRCLTGNTSTEDSTRDCHWYNLRRDCTPGTMASHVTQPQLKCHCTLDNASHLTAPTQKTVFMWGLSMYHSATSKSHIFHDINKKHQDNVLMTWCPTRIQLTPQEPPHEKMALCPLICRRKKKAHITVPYT